MSGFFIVYRFYIEKIYLCDMATQKQGISLNKLRRYQLIRDLYLKHKTEDIPTTVVLRKYIYPIYPISRTTLYSILATPIERELKQLESEIGEQTSLF